MNNKKYVIGQLKMNEHGRWEIFENEDKTAELRVGSIFEVRNQHHRWARNRVIGDVRRYYFMMPFNVDDNTIARILITNDC